MAIPEATEPINQLLARLRPALRPAGDTDPPPSEPLFHYTGSVGLEGILRSKTIRATHFLHLNDRDEVTAGEKLVCEVIQLLSFGEIGFGFVPLTQPRVSSAPLEPVLRIRRMQFDGP